MKPFSDCESMEAKLNELVLTPPSQDLSLKLSAALREADEEIRTPNNIIHHPFFQWSAAAAALFVALLMAVDSTNSPSAAGLAEMESMEEAAPQTVYEVIDGQLIPTSGRSAMMQTSFRGIEVIDGQTYRKFSDEDSSFLQPVSEEE
ncbi:MAG: hypothetical protein AAF191_04340 [Verrucomicrobiota bacterium]